jgi:glycosyltransferase involved in cell wall biosynthesis
MPPKISIVITVYNRKTLIQEAIESILAQEGVNLELIIWDDGSTDGTTYLVEKWAAQDSRIRWFWAANQGRVKALQAAHAQTTGDYVGWVDSDDRLLPGALAATAAILNSSAQVGMVYTQYRAIDTNGQVKGLGTRCLIPYSPERLLVDLMTFHFRLIRQEVFTAAGGINLDFPVAMDYDLCLRLSEITKIAHLPTPFYDYRVHSESISLKQRQQQLHYSSEAVRQALKRRGLDKFLRLEVDPKGMFSLHRLSSYLEPGMTE